MDTSKAHFANVLDRIRDGVERFWVFHLCAFFISVLAVQKNHGIIHASMANQLSHGICMGMLVGLFVQLVGERREWRLRKTYAFIATLIVGTASCWLCHANEPDQVHLLPHSTSFF